MSDAAMRPSVIRKDPARLAVAPNLPATDGVRSHFSWEECARELDGLPGGALNIAYEAVDRHVLHGDGDRVAIRWLPREGPPLDITYDELRRRTNRFANVLRSGLGLARGDRLFVLCERTPELYVGVLGALKAGLVVCPLFSAFGPEPVRMRLEIGKANAILTTEAFFRRKVEANVASLPSLRHILITGEPLAVLMAEASDEFAVEPTRPGDGSFLHFTSGTTGTPKGAMHVHGAAVMHYATGKYALDLHRDDIYWCTADPGWVTGTSYGIVAPLLHGVTSIVDEADFDAERWYRILEEQAVSVWYTAPTAIRMLMKAGPELARAHRFPKLRFVASVGEPLNPEAVWWGQDVLGLPIHDNWWQTETGGIMIANTPAMDIKPGSMGKPLPGVEAFIVARSEDGAVSLVEAPGIEGELALKSGWPAMFRGYLGQEERYRKCFAGDLYLTGDLAKRDADGYYWFVGRADDVIKSAGHLIGPFEVESALMEHPAVAEAGVIGKPDPVVGEVVKAFVSLRKGFAPSEALRLELLGHARKRLGAAVAPKEIAFAERLPKTRSGKIMRRLLKA
ncbi:MAG: acetate--CoA ligase, partial [Usitatibacter sp.]